MRHLTAVTTEMQVSIQLQLTYNSFVTHYLKNRIINFVSV